MSYYKLEKAKKFIEKAHAVIITERRTGKGYGHEVRAIVREWNGGRHGSPGEFVAIVRPRLGKNGTPLKTEPLIVKKLDEIKKVTTTGVIKNIQ